MIELCQIPSPRGGNFATTTELVLPLVQTVSKLVSRLLWTLWWRITNTSLTPWSVSMMAYRYYSSESYVILRHLRLEACALCGCTLQWMWYRTNELCVKIEVIMSVYLVSKTLAFLLHKTNTSENLCRPTRPMSHFQLCIIIAHEQKAEQWQKISSIYLTITTNNKTNRIEKLFSKPDQNFYWNMFILLYCHSY